MGKVVSPRNEKPKRRNHRVSHAENAVEDALREARIRKMKKDVETLGYIDWPLDAGQAATEASRKGNNEWERLFLTPEPGERETIAKSA